MKNFTIKVVIVIFALLSYSLNAQQCAFDKQRELLLQDPSYVQQEQLAEQKIQNYISENNFNRNGSIYTIPVVVHVLHLGEAVGTGSNISDAQIQSSIDHLNDFYRGLTPNSAVDFEIEFTLAQRDPNCTSTNGINRIDASGLPGYSEFGVNVLNSNGANYNDIASLISWPQTEYFNIWIVTELDGNDGGFGFQGYAYFYNEFSSTHGSVMMSSVFGYDPGNTNGWGLNSNGDNSTVVHEVGHYFHLYHTFQGDDTNNDGVSDACPADTTVGLDSDGCADTVPHQRETSTCPSNNTCTGNPWTDNNTVNNVMSYYFCTDRLTENQKARARGVMTGTNIVDNSKGEEPPVSGFNAPSATCSVNSPPANNFSGIVSVELNNTTFYSSTTEGDGGNIDNSVDCSGLFEIDTSVSNTINAEITNGNSHQLGVWIDWNNDGDFDDDSELQHLSDDIAGGATVSVPLIYPSTIPYGSFVRVRLITEVDDIFGVGLIDSACYTSLQYGQSEDYVIYVEPATLSIEEIDANELNIYSDYTNNELVLKGELLEATTVTLYDIQGRIVRDKMLETSSTIHRLNVNGLSSGVYIVKVSNRSQLKVKKVILD
ncbi:zinc-dependent metalloprotease [Winogradskyella aquimaris]|uniref:Zinc-dependent metalloprotease n=1 Tax=Winogradskyella aquimaris TaxID=864074 RepID=A0ABU5ELI7_9FLAO|nr:zinc-dependent metalloprotease [Winogradskyella aquimaris]MDY2586620.1 zinc-dependent metalloprotease [Winogradskyella aquimaris]